MFRPLRWDYLSHLWYGQILWSQSALHTRLYMWFVLKFAGIELQSLCDVVLWALASVSHRYHFSLVQSSCTALKMPHASLFCLQIPGSHRSLDCLYCFAFSPSVGMATHLSLLISLIFHSHHDHWGSHELFTHMKLNLCLQWRQSQSGNPRPVHLSLCCLGLWSTSPA